MDDEALRKRVLRGFAQETRILGTHAPGSRLLERRDVVAAIVASIPEYTLPNSAVTLAPGAMTYDILHELRSAYEDAGVAKWGVWLDPEDAESLAHLAASGLVFDSHPARMGGDLDAMDLGDPPDAERLSLGDAGRVNDLASGHADDRVSRMLAAIPPDLVHSYGVRSQDGEPASSVVVLEHEGDAAVWMVATVPWERNQGHAKRLMRRALADARERGCTTTTLLASELGKPVYAALGYRDLGDIHLWEQRP